MPNSQNSDIDSNIVVNTVGNVNDTLIYRENQTPLSTKGSEIIEQMRLERVRVTDLICILLIVASVAASATTFCITKNILSFGFLSALSALPTIRRRQEEAIFPISAEDKEIKLKELDVEIARIRQRRTFASLPLLTWIHRLIRKRP